MSAKVFFETKTPTLYRGWLAWKRVAIKIGEFQGRLLLAIIYFVLVGPISVLLRAMGQDPLAIRGKRKSYWAPRVAEKSISDSLHRQY